MIFFQKLDLKNNGKILSPNQCFSTLSTVKNFEVYPMGISGQDGGRFDGYDNLKVRNKKSSFGCFFMPKRAKIGKQNKPKIRRLLTAVWIFHELFGKFFTKFGGDLFWATLVTAALTTLPTAVPRSFPCSTMDLYSFLNYDFNLY